MTNGTSESSRKKTPTALKWSVVDQPPAKRWWWYVGFIFVSIYFGLLLTLLQQWTTLVVLVTIAVTILVVYRWKPREVAVTLDAEALTVNGESFPLDRFRSFSVDGEADQTYIILVPRKRFALPVCVAPSDSDSINKRILVQLEQQLPYVEVAPGAFERLVRWLRLT